jgi:hydroxymethylbilane synthase
MTATVNPMPRLKLGTRRSPLAMAQAEEARARLCAAHGWELGEVELVPVIASGDKVQDRALAEIGGKALWTRELDQWLAEGRIDAAVHSLKDVETIRPESLVIAAVLPRADKRDRLLGAATIGALPQGATIGTSAPRRAAQALRERRHPHGKAGGGRGGRDLPRRGGARAAGRARRGPSARSGRVAAGTVPRGDRPRMPHAR